MSSKEIRESKPSVEIVETIQNNDEDTETIVTENKFTLEDPFLNYSDQEIEDLITESEKEYERYNMESQIFSSFLKHSDPEFFLQIELMMSRMPQSIDELTSIGAFPSANSLFEIGSTKGSLHSKRSQFSAKSSSLKHPFGSVTGSLASTASRTPISCYMKIEICEKEIELMEKMKRKLEKQTFDKEIELETSIEEICISKAEITELTNTFDDVVMIKGINPVTLRVPAETFSKFLQNNIKRNSTLIDKMRLRSSSMKQNLMTIRKKLNLKEQLSGILRPIDFEMLQIEKYQFTKTLEEKNQHFVGLKQVNGQIALACSEQKKILEEKLKFLADLKRKHETVTNSINRMRQETESVKGKIDEMKVKIANLKYKMDNYKAPTVNQYADLKQKHAALEKQNKKLKRENTLHEAKLKNLKKQLAYKRKASAENTKRKIYDDN